MIKDEKRDFDSEAVSWDKVPGRVKLATDITGAIRKDVALPSGYLCIADLDSEGGLFHSDNSGVIHFGFDRDRMCQLFIEAGFDNVRHRTAATVMKPIHDGKMVEFTVFLVMGRKGA
ncbi:MAG: hypothetical protein NTZ24_14325 [Deltaproteobacteria bacterium]|nr:hypothetical protein [Deltaproteobacteria bacterium]